MNSLLWFGLCLSAINAPEPELTRFEFSQRLMGISFDVSVYAPNEAAANAAVEAAYGRVRQLNAIFSDYEPESELNRLCKTAGKGQAIPVSRELFEILETSVALSEKTDGAFDVTIGPVVRLWRKARRTKKLPTSEEIKAAQSLVGYRMMKLDPQAKTVELTKPGMQLDLGGIAVGYACDDILPLFRARGMTRVMIDASGDILCGDPPPGEMGWIVGFAPDQPEGPPTRRALIKNGAISSAGDAFQHVEFNGVRYSHIADPKTGLGLTDRSLVVVIAKDCTSADAWDTAISVLGPDRGLKFIAERPPAAVFIMRTAANEDKPQIFESPNLKKYLVTPSK